MAITNVSIEKGFYGYYSYDAKNKNWVFNPVGKEIILKDIQTNIDTNEITLIIQFDYMDELKTSSVSREVFTEFKLANKLASEGVDIKRETYRWAIDSLRLQENQLEKRNYKPIKIFSDLGWVQLNTAKGTKHCFRSYKLLGDAGEYTGDFEITPMGSFEDWRQMVIDDVLGDTVAELTLIAALSAVIVTIVTPVNDPGNPILHLYGISGCGKSTNLELATSVAGEPFEGDKISTTPNGFLKAVHSIYRSWGGTVNALVGSCAGNNGYPIILNELGKCEANNLTSLVYNFSEGTDKMRYSTAMKTTQAQGYATSFISSGEHSLLDRCRDKSDGLRVRVLELEMVKTPGGAKRADRIKAVCKKNNGHAIPMLAQHISGVGFQKVQELFKKNYEESIEMWTPSPSYERFVSKFVALYLTTADLASQALGIPFNKEAVRDFLIEYDKKNGAKRNSALSSYDMLMQEFEVQQQKFVGVNGKMPHGECWGKYTEVNKVSGNGKTISAQYLVYPNVVDMLLKENDFKNPNVCIKEWKKEGLIDFEKGKNTRSRKIDPTKGAVNVFVFNIFEKEDDEKETAIKLKRKG